MKTSIKLLSILFLLFALSCSDNPIDPIEIGNGGQTNNNDNGDQNDDDDDDKGDGEEGQLICCIRSFGGDLDDGSTTRGVVIKSTSDEGYVIAGYTNTSSGDFDGINQPGNQIIFLQKLNSDLDREWIRTIGGSFGPNDNQVYDMAQTSDGGYVVSGAFSSNDGDFTDQAKGVRSLYIWKTNAIGETEWLQTFGGTDWDDAHKVRETSDGGFIVTGRSASNNLDFKGLRTTGTNYMFLLKLNQSGGKEWLKSYPNSPQHNDYAYAVAQAEDGGYYMGGTLQPSIAILIKTDSQGETEWISTFDHISFGSVRDIEITDNGNLLLTGNNILMKTDPQGEIIWESDLRMGINGVTLLENGTFLITIQASGSYAPFTDLEHPYVRHLGLLNFDMDGNLLWKSAMGGSGWEEGRSVTSAPEGGYVAIGSASSDDGILHGLKKGTHQYLFVVRTDEKGQPIEIE